MRMGDLLALARRRDNLKRPTLALYFYVISCLANIKKKKPLTLVSEASCVSSEFRPSRVQAFVIHVIVSWK